MATTVHAQLAERIGVSTICMPGDSMPEALERALDEGFRSVDLIPHHCDRNLGWPDTVPPIGIDLDEITPTEIDRVIGIVQRFPYYNIHGPATDINLASHNRGITRETRRQYHQVFQFAVDCGAASVTFHPGMPPEPSQPGEHRHATERNIEFGKELADLAEKHDLDTGYENLGLYPDPDQMQQIIDAVGSDRLGLHFDVGHVWLDPVKDPMVWLRQLGRHLVAVHMHGAFHRPDRGFVNHQTLEQDGCTDLRAVMRALDDLDYDRGINLELHAPDLGTYFEFCRRSRDILIRAAT